MAVRVKAKRSGELRLDWPLLATLSPKARCPMFGPRTVLRRTIYPSLLFMTLVEVYLLHRLGIDPDVWVVYTYLPAAAVLFAVEHVIPRNPSWNYAEAGRPFRTKDAVIDLTFLFGVNPAAAAVRFLVATFVAGMLATSFELQPGLPLAPAAQAVVLLVSMDFLRYWIHRFQHRSAFLWRFHALHHVQDRLIAIRSSRTHPIDDWMIYTPEIVLYLALGFDPQVVAAVYSFVWVLSLCNHANVACHGGWLARIFMHPDHHVVHHAMLAPHEKTCNFGEILTLWDRVFGTFKHVEVPSDFKVGVATDAPRSLVRELLGSFYLRVERL